jgi:hypothetical protein
VELIRPTCWSWKVPPADRVRRKILAEASVTGYGAEFIDDDEWMRWQIMCEFHAERCAICGRRTMRQVTDHDHATGLIRGFLCNRCNVAEGLSTGEVYDKYRERNPASICGVRETYYSTWSGGSIVVVGSDAPGSPESARP